MFNNLDSYLNTKRKLTCELLVQGIDGSLSMVGRENDENILYGE
jgi:hypothetical protein